MSDVHKLANRIEQHNVSGEAITVSGQTISKDSVVDEAVEVTIQNRAMKQFSDRLREYAHRLRQNDITNPRQVFQTAMVVLCLLTPVMVEGNQPKTDFSQNIHQHVRVSSKPAPEFAKAMRKKHNLTIEATYHASLEPLLDEEYAFYPGGLRGALSDIRDAKNQHDMPFQNGTFYQGIHPEYTVDALSETVPVAVVHRDELETLSDWDLLGAYNPHEDGVVLSKNRLSGEKGRSVVIEELIHRWQRHAFEEQDPADVRHNVLFLNGLNYEGNPFRASVLNEQSDPDAYTNQAFEYLKYFGQAWEIDARLSAARRAWSEHNPGESITTLREAKAVLNWASDESLWRSSLPDDEKRQEATQKARRQTRLDELSSFRSVIKPDVWERLTEPLARRLLFTL